MSQQIKDPALKDRIREHHAACAVQAGEQRSCCSGSCAACVQPLDELARKNLQTAGVENVEFLKGEIEDIPLPDASADVIVGDCVIDLSLDKDREAAQDHDGQPKGRLGEGRFPEGVNVLSGFVRAVKPPAV